MARVIREIFEAGSLAGAGRRVAQIDAAARVEGAITRDRSAGSVEQNRRRLHRGAFGAGRVARRNPLRSRVATSVALRTRAGLEDRHLAKVETTFRRQSHPRRAFSGRLIASSE